MYPWGVQYAIDRAKETMLQNAKDKLKIGKAEYVDKDGNKQEIKLDNNEQK